MATFKEKIVALCHEVAAEFDGWAFVGGDFKNKSHKHTDIMISPVLSFNPGRTSFHPTLLVENKKISKFYKSIFMNKSIKYTFILGFSYVGNFPFKLRDKWIRAGSIVENKEFLVDFDGEHKPYHDGYIDYSEAKTALRDMMQDGIELLNRYFDLSSEENLLRALPPKYEPHFRWDLPPGMSDGNGLMVCIAHLLLGDFDFIEHYRSDDFKVIRPKRIADLDEIIAMLPELKKKYAETGKLI